MLPGGYWEAQGCFFEHSPLLPPHLRTVLLLIFTASNQAEKFSGQRWQNSPNLLLSLLRNRGGSLCKPQRAALSCILSFHVFPVLGGGLGWHSTAQSRATNIWNIFYIKKPLMCLAFFLAANSLVSPGFGS